MGRKIVLYADPTAIGERRFACKMKNTHSNGSIDGEISSPKGTSRNPLSQEEVQNKFFRLGSTILPERRLTEIIAKVERIETEEDVASIVPLMTAHSISSTTPSVTKE